MRRAALRQFPLALSIPDELSSWHSVICQGKRSISITGLGRKPHRQKVETPGEHDSMLEHNAGDDDELLEDAIDLKTLSMNLSSLRK